MRWGRGADESKGVVRAGTATLTIAGDEWSPWRQDGDAIRYVPGTLIRFGLRSLTDTRSGGWIPLYAGVVERWNPTTEGGADEWADVHLIETTGDIAVFVGLPPGIFVALDNIQEAVEWALGSLRKRWPYGLLITAGNRDETSYVRFTNDIANPEAMITQLHQYALAADVEIRPHRTGAIQIASRHHTMPSVFPLHEPSFLYDFSRDGSGLERVVFARSPVSGLAEPGDHAADGDLTYLAYDLDTIEAPTELDGLVNFATAVVKEGTDEFHLEYGVEESADRWGFAGQDLGELTLWSSDEPFPDPTGTNAAAWGQEVVERWVERRARNVLRVDGLDVTADTGVAGMATDQPLIVAAVDVGDPCWFYPPHHDPDPELIHLNRVRMDGWIRSYEHEVTPRPDGVEWRARFALDTRAIDNLPGAQL